MQEDPKWTNEEILNKIEWEGSLMDAIEYGIPAQRILDPKVSEAWARAESILNEFTKVEQEIRELLEDE